MKKGCCLGMLPQEMELEARLALAKKLGFDGVEPGTIKKKSDLRKLKKAAENTGIEIIDIMNSDHWRYPLSSPRKSDVARSIRCMETSLENAAALGTDCVLLVPAVVNEEVTYEEAWKRSRAAIRKLIPKARKLGVVIAVENVWNNLWVKPRVFRNFVESFKSPWVRAYFDIANHVKYCRPEEWILTLSELIVKCHVKEFKLNLWDPNGGGSWEQIREGSVRWPIVRRALERIGYNGWTTIEGCKLPLKEASRRLDLIIAGK